MGFCFIPFNAGGKKKNIFPLEKVEKRNATLKLIYKDLKGERKRRERQWRERERGEREREKERERKDQRREKVNEKGSEKMTN